nr:protein translocase subunit SecF [Candidatus Dadabacteria bacterium]NIQ17115.1 protein translocase subunit SecF [Candidatus Dadabacteria bacterium]
MELIKPDTNFDFVSKMHLAARISLILAIISIASLVYHKGPNWGNEFTGGTEIHIKLAKQVNVNNIRKSLKDDGFPSKSVQQFGLTKDNEYLIRFSPELVAFDQIKEFQQKLEKLFITSSDFKGASILRIDYIGPKVGKELVNKAILSIMVACVGILIYLIFRFEFGFAMGAVIALLHDSLIT